MELWWRIQGADSLSAVVCTKVCALTAPFPIDFFRTTLTSRPRKSRLVRRNLQALPPPC